MRYKVTVVGAGNVGATTAQRIAEAELADVVMVDVAADLATGKALDMMEAAPVLGFNAKISGGGDYGPTEGCVAVARGDLLRLLVEAGPDTRLRIATMA